MSVGVFANNADGSSEEKGRLELVDTFPGYMEQWNTNEEAARYLASVDFHTEWMSDKPVQKPASGQMFIFDKRQVKFKKDGYDWKRRKDGRTPREDHMRLKVFGVELLYGCYAHSANSPTFHRRCYWLLTKPNTVLVHYLDVPSEDKSLAGISDTDLLQLVMSKPCVMDQLRSQLSNSMLPLTRAAAPEPRLVHPGAAHSPATPVVQPLPGHHLQHQQHLQQQQQHHQQHHQQHLQQQQQQQLSTVLLDTTAAAYADPAVIDNVLRFDEYARDYPNISSSRGSCSVPGSPQVVSRQQSPSSGGSETLRRPGSWPHLDSPPAKRPTSCSAGGVPVLQQPHGSPAPIDISDFCPDWAYEEGGTKVVVTGIIPEGAEYGLAFGDEYVPASVVQPGVLRCFCPPHSPELVQLQLYCNQIPVAKPAVFDYRHRPSVCSSPQPGSNGLRSCNSDHEMQFPMDESIVKTEPQCGDQFSFPSPVQAAARCNGDLTWRLGHSSPFDSTSSQQNTASDRSNWAGPFATPSESDSSFPTPMSTTSSCTSVGSIFDDPGAPSVAEWCAVLSDGRNVLQEDFNRLDLTDTEQQQLFFAAATIQSAFRKYRRKTMEEEKQNSAALLIQNRYRRYRHVSKRQESMRNRETVAALKIQRFLRRSMYMRRNRGINQWPRSACSKLPLFVGKD